MSDLFSQDSMAEFFVQSIISHWFVAILLVSLVALFVTSRKSLNATTRHNIWLITLVGFLLMPLLVFIPKPDISVNLLDLITLPSTENSNAAVDQSSPVAANTVDTSVLTTNGLNNNAEFSANKPDALNENPYVSSANVQNFDVSEPNSPVLNFPVLLKGIFIFWIVGSLYFIRRIWGEYRAARELELQSDSVTPYFERRFAALCERLEIKEKPLIRFHAGINAPMTVGLVRVWVAIPMTWREEIDDDIFDQTLTHELGHIARKDPLVNTIQRLINIVFWMYPAVWYVSRQLELERESACDDWVLTHDGKGHTYANNLLNVAESLYLQPHVLAVGCLRSHSQLSRRIQNLLNKSSDHAVKNSRKLLFATTVGLLVTLSASAVMFPEAPERELPVSTLSTAKAPAPGSAKTVPDTQINFSDKGMQILVDGEEVPRQDEKPVHDPKLTPKPPVPPKAVSNYGDNTHNYAYSQNSVKHSNVIETNNGKYGSGALSIERVDGKQIKVSVTPEIKKSKEPVLHAVWNDDWLELKRLIKQGKDINAFYKRPTAPRSALNAAILRGNLDMVEFLHEAGAKINSKSRDWNRRYGESNALTMAAVVGDENIAKYLYKQGAKPDDSTMIVAVQSKNTGLVDYFLKQDFEADDSLAIIAVQNRDSDMLDVLLKHDVEVDDGAVMMAVQNRDKKMAKHLIKETGEIDSGALIMAIQNHDAEMVDWLLDAGAEPDGGALIMAIQNKDKKLVKLLIDAGADIDGGALIMAIQNRDNDMIDWLLDAGADADDGAVVMAVQNRNKPLVKRLLRAGADIDDGALIMALQSRDTEMVQWLLDAGADADDGALIMAIQNGETKLAKKLLDAGADIDDGALIIAIQSRDRKMVEWLIDAGADVDDGAMIVAMQMGDKKIINLIQEQYKGGLDHQSYSKNKNRNKYKNKNYSIEDLKAMGMTDSVNALENLESLKALEGLEVLSELEGLENLEEISVHMGEKFGQQLGEEIANGVVNFIGDMSTNGGNVESIALVKALEIDDADLALDLLNDGAIPNTLHITQALENRNSKLVKKFLSAGAKPNGLNILQALENEEYDLAERFMKLGAKPNGIALLKAIETEDKALIKLVRSYMKEDKAKQHSNENSFYENGSIYLASSGNENECDADAHRGLNFSKWPVNSNKISLNFGKSAKHYHLTGRDLHRGVDLPVSEGQKIRSVADGVVYKAKYSKKYGNYLVIKHADGYSTLYANNQKNLVKVGQHVKVNQTIATVGNTGQNSTGPHLHFEVLYHGAAHNPNHFHAKSDTSS